MWIDSLHDQNYKVLAEVPSAARVNLPPNDAGIKPGPKPSLERWGCVCKISSRSVQGFGFALHIPTDRQTNKQTSVRPFI